MAKRKGHVPTAAKEIALAIASIDTDDRLKLFNLVREELQKRSQYYTARCFAAMGVLYEGVENTEDERDGD